MRERTYMQMDIQTRLSQYFAPLPGRGRGGGNTQTNVGRNINPAKLRLMEAAKARPRRDVELTYSCRVNSPAGDDARRRPPRSNCCEIWDRTGTQTAAIGSLRTVIGVEDTSRTKMSGLGIERSLALALAVKMLSSSTCLTDRQTNRHAHRSTKAEYLTRLSTHYAVELLRLNNGQNARRYTLRAVMNVNGGDVGGGGGGGDDDDWGQYCWPLCVENHSDLRHLATDCETERYREPAARKNVSGVQKRDGRVHGPCSRALSRHRPRSRRRVIADTRERG